MTREDPFREKLRGMESVLWQGKPNKRAFVLRGSVFMMPFSIFFAGASIVFEVAGILSGGIFAAIWGIPFVLIGLYLLIGRFFVAARQADNTVYAMTDKRILIQAGRFAADFIEMDLADIPYLQVSKSRSGVGTIYFDRPGYHDQFAVAGLSGGARLSPSFVTIDNASEVYETVRRAREDARKALHMKGETE